jgi:diguanylate cyclase (GGDEF)-like protein/putative nucleotidyltransferase with HDIG domain
MNISALIPLIASIAYIPLFVILIFNRPWQRQHKLLFWYLVPAILWSFTGSLFRSDFFLEYKLILLKTGLWLAIWMGIQFLYIIQYFSKTQFFKLSFTYILLAILIVLEILGYVPRDLVVSVEGISVYYGFWYIGLALLLFLLISGDLYYLFRRLIISKNIEERNQISYLLAGITILLVLAIISFAPSGGVFPLTHIGNFINCVILSYIFLRHRLVDVRFVMRRSIVYTLTALAVMAIYALWLSLMHIVLHLDYNLTSFLAAGLITAISGILFWAFLHVYLYRKVEQAFFRKSYDSRQELLDFFKRRAPMVTDLNEFSGELLLLLTRAMKSSCACLFLPDSITNDFVAQFTNPEGKANSQPVLKQGSPVLQWLQRGNKYLNVENLDILPEFRGIWAEEKNGLEALQVELLFPLISRGNLIAILALGKKESGKYSVEDVDLVETVATQVAASLEKEYLQEQLRKRDQELELINRLSNVITSSLNIQDVYGAFISELKQVVDVNWATIAVIEDDEIRFEVLSTDIGSTWQAGEEMPLKGTGIEWVANNKKALVEPDLAKSTRFNSGEEYLKWGIRSIIYLPLMVKNEAIGSLVIASREPNAYSPEQVRLLEGLASQIAVPVENSRLYAKAEQRARVDELTGLFNRRHFDESVKLEIDRHARYRSMLSLIFLDLDLFKAYNDMQGHTAGDKVLELVGKLVNGALRSTDLACRYGGDEFAIILPQSASNDAFVVAERVRGRIAAEMSKRDIKITASLGLASWPIDGVTSDELVNAADKALYYAKETGGNRTCVASKMLPSLTATATTRTTTEKEVLSIIHNLAVTIEARDPFTYGHSRKVSSYAMSLAEAIGLTSEKVAVVSTAALLHDIGKIGVPDEVLNKVDKLEPEAWELIRAHPKLSTTIVGHVVSLVSCLPAILHHHERWDGGGYPAGLKGDEIPVEARVLAIADAFDAMTSSRPYRNKLSYKKVLKELKNCSGTQFDPKLIEAFMPIALSAAPEESEVV